MRLITNYPEEAYPDLLLIYEKCKKRSKVACNTKASLMTNYDEEKNDRNIEAGDFMLQLGNSSVDISQKLKIAVK